MKILDAEIFGVFLCKKMVRDIKTGRKAEKGNHRVEIGNHSCRNFDKNMLQYIYMHYAQKIRRKRQ